MLFGIGGFLYSPGAVLSILASVSMSIEQGSDVDAISILLSLSSIVDDGKYNTIINVLSGSYVAWGVASENRETFRYSDDFVIQDGDACVDILVASNLGKDRFEYIIFFRDGELVNASVFSNQGYVDSTRSAYITMEREWRENGYVGRYD